jgi:quinol monooxygenase YgiN
MSYAVVATYVAKPDQVEPLRGHLKAMVGPTNAEEGCELYRVVSSNDDPETFVLFELYRDEDAFQAHAASDHFEQHIRNGAWNCLESRSVVFGTELER